MKKIYILNIVKGKNKEEVKFNATNKAPADAARAVVQAGGVEIILRKDTTDIRLLNIILDFIRVLVLCVKLLFVLKKNDRLIIQNRLSFIKMKVVTSIVRAAGAKVVYLVHDLNYMRYDRGGKQNSKKCKSEMRRVNMADILIVHTFAMKQFLEDLGVCCEMHVLYLFDYYTDGTEDERSQINDRYKIVFGGNLEKSEFIKPLNAMRFDKIQFNMYGFSNPGFMDNESLCYKGRFSPEKVSAISGGWGLVWDGTSVDTCSGPMGEYLRYISSHKASLYLAAGLPLIIWSASSLKDFVIENNIGIVVDSLTQLEDRLLALSDDEYRTLETNAIDLGKRLKHGEMLGSVLKCLS